MNRRIYEATFLKAQSTAIECYEKCIRVLKGQYSGEDPVEELTRQLANLKNAEDMLSLMKLRFQDDAVNFQQIQAEPQWRTLMERIVNIERHLAPPPDDQVALEKDDLSARSTSFRESQGGKLPYKVRVPEEEE